MTEYIVIFTTLPNAEHAENLAQSLVENRLVACVNILPQMSSIYRWQGKLEKGQEHLLIVKTRQARCDEVIEAIRSQHPYELAEIIALPIAAGLPGYLSWIDECTAEQ